MVAHLHLTSRKKAGFPPVIGRRLTVKPLFCFWQHKQQVLGVLAQLLRSLVSASVDVVLFVLGDDTFLDNDVIVGVNHVDFSNGWSFSFRIGGMALVWSFVVFGQGRNLRATTHSSLHHTTGSSPAHRESGWHHHSLKRSHHQTLIAKRRI